MKLVRKNNVLDCDIGTKKYNSFSLPNRMKPFLLVKYTPAAAEEFILEDDI